jgi:lipopolysaccharide transport system permease protein
MKLPNPFRLLQRGRSWKRLRAIVLFRTYAYFALGKEGTYGGFLWYLIAPAMASATYLAIGTFLRHREENFIAFVICGSVVWQLFSSGITTMSDSILNAKQVIQQVSVPKILFPIDNLLCELIEYLFSLAVLITGLACFGFLPGIHALALPLCLFLQALLLLGIGLPLAALVPFFYDLREILRSLMRLLGLLSGIFFSAANMSPTASFFFHLNPMAHVLEWYRGILLYDTWPSWSSLAYVALWGVLGTCLGARMIARRDHQFIKVMQK